MRQSLLFTKTRKEAPKDEVSKNAQLLIRAGYIHKEMAGVYDYLPLGLRTLEKVNDIIRKEMNAIGGQELLLSALQDPLLWQKTDRWDEEKVDSWFKTKLQNDTVLGLGFTHEEPLTRIMKEHIHSYRDLPQYVYQVQDKFRNELRAKSGIMRGREFLMKDLYSFSQNNDEHDAFYEKAKEAYLTIFKRAGLGDRTYVTFASGGVFSEYSHEFQTLCNAGEDTIYVSKEKNIAVNKEVYTDEVLSDLGLDEEMLIKEKAIEVGNIFSLGTRFSEALGLVYKDETGNEHPVVMGSYGIGPGRLMGTIAEIYSDEKGLMWPESVAPFKVHLLVIASGEGKGVHTEAEKLYMSLLDKGVEVLYDDREARAGEKLADADLLGIPYRVVISEKTLEKKSVEVKKRSEDDVELVSLAQCLEKF